MQSYTPPTTSYGWPTGSRLIDRLQIDRGLCVITDGAGGWRTIETPYAGDLEGLVEGVDYFLGGHVYLVADDVLPTLPPPSGGGGGTPPPPPPPGGGGPFGYGIDGYGVDGYGT